MLVPITHSFPLITVWNTKKPSLGTFENNAVCDFNCNRATERSISVASHGKNSLNSGYSTKSTHKISIQIYPVKLHKENKNLLRSNKMCVNSNKSLNNEKVWRVKKVNESKCVFCMWFSIGFLFITARRHQLRSFCVKFKCSVVSGSCNSLQQNSNDFCFRYGRKKNDPFQFRIYNQYNKIIEDRRNRCCAKTKIRSHTWHI